MGDLVLRNLFSAYPVPARVAAAEVEKVAKAKGGAFRASDVVDAARPEDAPLHPAFEWDDAIAAEQYRLAQARSLIKSIRVVSEEGGETEPVYVHAVTDARQGKGVYLPVRSIVEGTANRVVAAAVQPAPRADAEGTAEDALDRAWRTAESALRAGLAAAADFRRLAAAAGREQEARARIRGVLAAELEVLDADR